VFDVNCRICTGSAEDINPPSLTFSQSNMSANAPSKHSDSSQDVARSGHSPRKKICLAQRLKMYSTELQRNSTSTADMLPDEKCISQKVSSVNMATQQKPEHSLEKPTVSEPKVKTDAVELQMLTGHMLQKASSVESENADQKKLEESLAVVHEQPHQDSATSLLSDVAKQQVVSPVSFEKNLTAAGYVTV